MRQGQRVVLHIGAMKTGTSFVQQVLVENPGALAADGAVFPGDHGWFSQIHAARDVIGIRHGDPTDRDVAGAWDRLVETMAGHDATSIVSMEFLSFAGPEKAARVVESLAPATVEVVLTVRDAGRVLPAQWQENTQNRGTLSWREWCADVTDPTRPHNAARRSAMRALRVAYMLEVWSALVPPERIHVVTVPPSGSDPSLLWQRFAEAAGLTPGGYTMPAAAANEALGHVSAELMRRLNVRVEDLPARGYIDAAKTQLAKHVLATRRGEPGVVLPQALVDLARSLDARSVDGIADSGARVVGDLGDLSLGTTPDPEVVVVTDRQLVPTARYAAAAIREVAADRGIDVPTSSARWPDRFSLSPAARLAPHMDDLEAAVRALAAASPPGRRASGGAVSADGGVRDGQ